VNREELWKEATKFCEYVNEHFSSVRSIWVYGSYLWRDDPNDMDVYIDGEDALIQELSEVSFPNIHPSNSHEQTKNKVLIWTRDNGMLKDELPDRQELMMKEILALREQIDKLHMKDKSPPCTHSDDMEVKE